MDVGIIVLSTVEPEFSTHLVDVSLSAGSLDAYHPVIIIQKTDLLDEAGMARLVDIKARYEKWLSGLFLDRKS